MRKWGEWEKMARRRDRSNFCPMSKKKKDSYNLSLFGMVRNQDLFHNDVIHEILYLLINLTINKLQNPIVSYITLKCQ